MRGDVLAAGGTKAQFPSNSSVTAAKWASIFDDFDPETYKAKIDAEEADKEQRRLHADEVAAGNAGLEFGKDIGDPRS